MDSARSSALSCSTSAALRAHSSAESPSVSTSELIGPRFGRLIMLVVIATEASTPMALCVRTAGARVGIAAVAAAQALFERSIAQRTASKLLFDRFW